MLKRTLKALAGVDLPVIAGYDTSEGIPTKVVLAMHQCDECDTSVIASKMFSPSCPVCASSIKVVSSDDLELTRRQVKEFSPIGVCAKCDTSFCGTEEVAAALDDGKFHCLVCANIVHAMDDEEAGDVDSEEEDSSMDDGSDDTSEVEDEDDVGEDDIGDDSDMGDDESDVSESLDVSDDLPEDMGDDSDMGDESDMDGEDDGSDPLLDDESGADEEMSGDDMGGDDADMSDDESDMGDETTDADDLEADSEEDLDASPLPEDDEELDSIEARVIDYVNDAARFELVMASGDGSDPQWYLFADNVPVAIASRAKAKATIQAFFATDKFKNTFTVAASDDGLTTEMMDDYGFEPVKVDIPVTDVVKKQTEDSIKEATASLKKKTDTLVEAFTQALGIAAVGINKGVYYPNNPLFAGLVEKLSQNRVRNADAIVAAAFRDHGEEFLQALVAKAIELVDKTPEGREEIAEMVTEATYRQPIAEDAPQETSRKIRTMSFMASNEGDEEDHGKGKSQDFKSRVEAAVNQIGA